MRSSLSSRIHVLLAPSRISLAAALCLAVFSLGGCATRISKAHTIPWSSAPQIKPIVRPFSAASSPETEDLSELEAGVVLPNSPFMPARGTPARPRVAPPPAAPVEENSRPRTPILSPDLTPIESSAAEEEARQSLDVAEKNIAVTQGRTLNATQSDLASKVRSFIAEAREAARVRDWPRSRNAAKKAEVLSNELAKSL
jgi:outer membrane murein-binding lipoprotein Lpp